MNSQQINSNVAAIMAQMDRDNMHQPRFANQHELDAWKAESQAIEKAAKVAGAEMIAAGLIAMFSIADSLAKIASKDDPGNQTLFGKPISDADLKKPRMPRLDEGGVDNGKL